MVVSFIITKRILKRERGGGGIERGQGEEGERGVGVERQRFSDAITNP